jgi:hypothetical protein
MQSYQTLAARPRQSLTSSSGRLAQTVDEIAAARNCGRSLGFQAGQALYSHLVSDFHFFETRHSAAMGQFTEASLSGRKRKIVGEICVRSNFRLDRGFMEMSSAVAA